MEEKERYEYFFGTNTVKDNKTNQFYGCVVDLLNQQDKRIKELEEENQQLKKQLADTEEMRLENLNDGCRCVERDSKIIVKLQQENQQLKQQLQDLPKKITKYFYDEIRHRAILEDDYCPNHNLERKYGVRKCLLENIRTTILKKYGGEDE